MPLKKAVVTILHITFVDDAKGINHYKAHLTFATAESSPSSPHYAPLPVTLTLLNVPPVVLLPPAGRRTPLPDIAACPCAPYGSDTWHASVTFSRCMNSFATSVRASVRLQGSLVSFEIRSTAAIRRRFDSHSALIPTRRAFMRVNTLKGLVDLEYGRQQQSVVRTTLRVSDRNDVGEKARQ